MVLALYLLLPRLVDTQQTLDYISNASYVLLGLAVALEIAALGGYANLFRYILRVLDIRMRLREVWAITLSGLAVSHILSAGGVGGWVVTYNALMKHKVPHGIIFVAIAAQQFFNYVVLWFFFALAIVYLILVRGSDSIFGYLVGIALIALILWLTLYGVYLYNRPTRLRVRATQIAHLVNRVWRREVVKERHIDGWIDNLLIGMRRMVRYRGSFRTTAVLACTFWLFDMLCLWCTFQAFGYTIGLGHLLVAYVVAYSIGTLAPTPGGLGAVEGLLIALFVSFGVPSAVAVAVVLVYRIINFWLPIPPGFIAYAVVRPGRTPVMEGEVEAAAGEAPRELDARR
ncbi:MAG TPA: flippase-like domain-containing protein [Thermoleophilia bacterium]|nr:flippase-like domain-containing protein [Thermoleophilia bacterium]